MKTKKLKTLVFAILGILTLIPRAYSQGDGSDWQSNETCLKNLSLYYEFYKHKNYKDAIGPWRVVYKVCPESKESLYAHGVTMYRHFAGQESDPEVQKALVDTMMMIYDRRIEYYPKNKGDILGRKGVDLLRFMRQAGEEYVQMGYDILTESIEIDGEKSDAAYLVTQISAGIPLFLSGKLEGEKLINNYVTAKNILESQKPTSKVVRAKEAIDTNIKESKVMTCESIVKIFGPKFEESKDDTKYLDLVAGFLNDAGSCEKEPFFAQIAERRYELNPDASAAYDLAVLFQSKSEYKRAKEYFLNAIELAENDDDKANYYYRLAFLSQEYLDSPIDAADYSYKAVSLKPDWGDPYILIGLAYISGNGSLGEDFERRTAYWVAVDMFQKAKSVDPAIAEKANSLISSYRDYFPTKEDLFFRSISENSPYKVGGWIQKTTSARPKN